MVNFGEILLLYTLGEANLVKLTSDIRTKETPYTYKKDFRNPCGTVLVITKSFSVDCTAGRFAAGSSSDGVERLFLPSIEDKIFQSKISNVTSMRTEAK